MKKYKYYMNIRQEIENWNKGRIKKKQAEIAVQ